MRASQFGVKCLYRLEQAEVLFESLNEIARCANFKGQLDFDATLQEMLLVMSDKPIRFGTDCFCQYVCIRVVVNIGLGCFYLMLRWRSRCFCLSRRKQLCQSG